MKVFLNGKLVDKADAKVSVFDHGFLYGDGVFEGIRIYEGCIFKLDEHLERLEYSAKAICLNLPWTREQLAQFTVDTCRANNLRNGYIRLVVSRGDGDLGLSPKLCKEPNIVIIADKISLYPQELYDKGMRIVTVPTRRINPAALPPMVKSLNYLNNILGKIEAHNAGVAEAIMLNDQGYVAECTADNVFIVLKGRILTPAGYSGALRGITRDVVIGLAREAGIEVVETNLTRYDLFIADECFLTGTGAELIPVVDIDARRIGTGQPGPVTKDILARFKSVVTRQGTMT